MDGQAGEGSRSTSGREEIIKLVLPLLHSHPVVAGIVGTVTGGTGSAIALLASANIVLAFIAGLFGAVTAVFTCLIVIRKWRAGRH